MNLFLCHRHGLPTRTRRMSALLTLVVLLVAGLTGCVPMSTAMPADRATVQPAASASAAAVAPDSLDGQWAGSIQIAGQTIDVVVKFSGRGADLKASMDVPTQGAKDLALSKVSQQGSKVHFEAFSGARLATYDGEMQSDQSLKGQFKQSGLTGDLTLQRAAASPTAVLPYRQEEVSFKNGDVTLAGTLTLPQQGAAFPAVVLISGSGAQDRDEDILGFEPFRLIADHLTRNGVAVLRYDDRGVGGSSGDLTQATSEDLAGDVLAGVALLKARSDIDAGHIGLLGHSEGGMIAPIAAARSSDVAFIVLMSGPALPGQVILRQQLTDIMKVGGATQDAIDKALAEQERTLAAVRTGQGWDQLVAGWKRDARTQMDAMPEDQRKALGDLDKAADAAAQAQRQAVDTPWFKFFLSYDPAAALAQVKVPILALYGGKDSQVAADANEQALRSAVAKSSNTGLTTKIFPNANHLYQEATTGSPSEYGGLKKEFVPGFLDFVTQWIKKTTGKA